MLALTGLDEMLTGAGRRARPTAAARTTPARDSATTDLSEMVQALLTGPRPRTEHPWGVLPPPFGDSYQGGPSLADEVKRSGVAEGEPEVPSTAQFTPGGTSGTGEASCESLAGCWGRQLRQKPKLPPVPGSTRIVTQPGAFWDHPMVNPNGWK